MIFFTKFIYNFLLPPGIFVVLMLILTGWLYQREKKAARLLLLLAILLYTSSMPFVGNLLIHSLESRYHPPQIIKGDVIITLGGGATSDTPDIDGSLGHLSGSASSRLLTTARLHQKIGLPIILVGGQVYEDSGNEAEIAKRLLVNLGVAPRKIILESKSRNTEENAQNTKDVLASYRFQRPILVTSAFHMARSVRNFAKVGIKVTPYPTNYMTNIKPKLHYNSLAPSFSGLYVTGIALKEYLGLAVLTF